MTQQSLCKFAQMKSSIYPLHIDYSWRVGRRQRSQPIISTTLRAKAYQSCVMGFWAEGKTGHQSDGPIASLYGNSREILGTTGFVLGVLTDSK